MRHFRIALLACAMGMSVLGVFPEGIREAYPAAYGHALATVEATGRHMAEVITGFGADPELLVPVVFPEMLRFSAVSDAFESFAVELLYKRVGSGTCDFSIGAFQMKPSFAEAIEARVDADPGLASPALQDALSTGGKDGYEGRASRLKRLGSMEGQLAYLSAFHLIMKKDHDAELAALDREGQIRFLASAYNAGFWLPSRHFLAIEAASSFPRFPGQKDKGFRFADVAAEFHHDWWVWNNPASTRDSPADLPRGPTFSRVGPAAWPSNR